MRRRLLVVTAVLLVGAAVIIWLATRPEPWRPDTHTPWPPAQTWEKGLPKGFTPPPPQTEVLWTDYRVGFKDDIDDAGDNHDCAALNELFNEAADAETRDRLALTYISRWSTQLNCPQVAEE